MVQENVDFARGCARQTGRFELSWDHFSAVLQALSDLESRELRANHAHTEGTAFNEGRLKGGLHVFEAIKGVMTELKEDPSFHQHMPACGLVLSKTRSRKAGNPRDKVYGLYGILAECGVTGLSVIDYNKSIEDIYTEFTRAAILSDPSPYILSGIKANPRNGLPSWVPDYADTTETLTYLNQFVASKKSPWVYSFEPGDKITLSSVIIDTLGDVANSKSRNSTDDERFVHHHRRDPAGAFCAMVLEVSQTFQDWARVVGDRDRVYPTGELASQALYHILHGGTRIRGNDDGQEAAALEDLDVLMTILTANDPIKGISMDALRNKMQHHSHLDMLQRVWRSKGYDRDILTDEDDMQIWAAVQICPAQSMVASMGTQSYGRTLYTTYAGYMGLRPRSVQAGDVIALFSGIKAPFIPRSAEARGSEAEYRMIGPAYVYGVMDGEKWPDDTVAVPITIV